MSDPVGYFLTWTCYGQWLHGDERGSVDRDHNTPGTPTLPPDPERAELAARLMRYPPVVLDTAARALVTATIRDHCRIRAWNLLAVNVRTNHVHVVVEYPGVKPEVILAQLKAWTTRRLREARLLPAGAHAWTREGSTGYLWKPSDVDAAVAYVMEAQDDRH